jgi:hypothetical protein
MIDELRTCSKLNFQIRFSDTNLNTTLLWRATPIVGDRGQIGDGRHPHTGGLNRPDGGLASRARSFDEHFHLLQPHRLGGFDRLFGSQPRGKGSALP